MSEPEQSLGQTSPDEALRRADLAIDQNIRRNKMNKGLRLAAMSMDEALAVNMVSLKYMMSKNIANAAWLEQLPLEPDLKAQIQARMNQNSADWVGFIETITGLPEAPLRS